MGPKDWGTSPQSKLKFNNNKGDYNKSRTAVGKLVWALIALYILVFGCISFFKYQSFGYIDFDLAIHAQTVWNILHGSIHSSILGIDFLGNHANFILFLIAPIYFLFQHPITLLFLQTLSLALAAYPIYLIAKEELNEMIGLAVVFIYLLYPALGYVNLFEFHPTVFATLFLVFMFYYFKKQNFKKFILFMILSLLCQESIPLLIVPMGIYALFLKKKPKWVFTPILLGGIWFLFTVGKLIPYFNKDTVQFINLYRHLGNSAFDVIKFIVTHPIELARIIFTRPKILFMIHLFMPLSFLPLFDPRILIASLALFQHLLSRRLSEHGIYYHYTAEMIPFIFISAIYGIKRFLKIFKISYNKINLTQMIFLSLIVIVAIVSNFYLGPQLRFGRHANVIYNTNALRKDVWDYQKERFLGLVPANASIIATFEFLPSLSHRKNLYSLHHVTMGFYTLSNKPYHLPEDVEYALLDFNDFLTFNSFYRPGSSDANLRNFILENKWGVVDISGSIVLLKRDHISEYNLYKVLERLPEISNKNKAFVSDELELLGYNIKHKQDAHKGKLIKLTFYWKALKKVEKDYGSFIDISDRYNEIKYRFIKPICYRVFPAYVWQKGQIVTEDYNLFIPEDIKGKVYSVRMGVFDYKTNRIYPMFSSIPRVVDENGLVNLVDLEVN